MACSYHLFSSNEPCTTAVTGVKAGGGYWPFSWSILDFFYIAFNLSYPYIAFVLNVAIAIVAFGITGVVVALVNGKMSQKE